MINVLLNSQTLQNNNKLDGSGAMLKIFEANGQGGCVTNMMITTIGKTTSDCSFTLWISSKGELNSVNRIVIKKGSDAGYFRTMLTRVFIGGNDTLYISASNLDMEGNQFALTFTGVVY